MCEKEKLFSKHELSVPQEKAIQDFGDLLLDRSGNFLHLYQQK